MSHLFFLSYPDNHFEVTDDPNYQKMFLCVQEILLWRGEAPFNDELGIDYQSIFNGRAFLRTQLEDIVDKHRKYFKSINLEVKVENKIVEINLDFVFNEEAITSNQYSKRVKIKRGTEGELQNAYII